MPRISEAEDGDWAASSSGNGVRGKHTFRILPNTLHRLMLLVLLIALIPALLLQVGIYSYWYEWRYRDAEQNNAELADAVAMGLYAFMRDVGHQEQGIGAALDALQSASPDTIGHFLSSAAAAYPSIDALLWVSAEGRILGATPQSAVGIEIHDRVCLERALASHRWVLGDLVREKNGRRARFSVAYGVRDAGGAPLGVIVAMIDPERLDAEALRIQPGTGRVILIFDGARRLVFRSPPLALTWEQRQAFQGSALFGVSTARREPAVRYISQLDGQERVGAWAGVTETDWVVVAAQLRRDIEEPLRRSILIVAGLNALLFAASMGLALLIARRVTRGTNLLLDYAHALTHGDLEHRSPQPGVRELDRLAEGMNAMTAARKRQETALRESEERFRAIYERAAVGIAQLDLAGRFLDVNPRLCEFLGYTREELLQRTFESITHPDDLGLERVRIENLLQGRAESYTLEKRYLHKDGQWVWVRIASSLAHDAAGRHAYRITIIEDITGRKQAESALRQSEERFRLVVESSPNALVMVDRNGTISLINRQGERLFGYRREELIGQPVETLVPDRVRPEHVSYRRRFTAEPQQRPMGAGRDLFARRKDGTEVPVEIGLTPVETPHGLFVLATVTDITQRKEAEAALRRSEERFRLVAEALPQIVWTADPNGVLDYYNPRWSEYTGVPAPEARGWSWQSVLYPGDQALTVELWSQSLRTGQLFQVEHRLRRSDGVYRWHLSRALPLRGDDGRIHKWFGASTDIEDQKRTEAALAETAEELARSNRDLEQFAYIASHDLQEPLRMISGYISLLRENYGEALKGEAQEFMDYALDGAGRMQRLIQDLLAYSRVGTRGMQPKEIAMQAVFDTAVANHRATIQETGAAVTCDPLPVVWGDETQLSQLLGNLIGNALKFRRETERPRVHLSARREGRAWLFAVRDNGIGLDPKYADRIFMIFQRLHTREKYPGSGIGLAICKKIVERHGGRIWLESQPGQGATFFFTISDLRREGERHE